MRLLLLALVVGKSAPPVGVAVSPARIAVIAPASRTLSVRNVGTAPVVVTVARRPAAWLTIRPWRLTLRPGSRAVLTVRARTRPRTPPGDHQRIVMVSARPADGGRIAIRMRVGVRLRVRVPGRLVRRLDIGGVRVRRQSHARVLVVSVANRGNVVEQLRGRLRVRLLRSRRLVSRLALKRPYEVVPGRRANVRFRYTGRARGRVTAIVAIGKVERRYRLRL